MRWKWLDFTQEHPGDFWDLRGSLVGHRLMRRSGSGTRIPEWVWDLYEITLAEYAGREAIRPAILVFRSRFSHARRVVNQPGGVDPGAFSAALRLGDWDAVRQLHAVLRPAAY